MKSQVAKEAAAKSGENSAESDEYWHFIPEVKGKVLLGKAAALPKQACLKLVAPMWLPEHLQGGLRATICAPLRWSRTRR